MNDLEATLVESLRAKVAGIDHDSLTYPDWEPDRLIVSASVDTTKRHGGRRLAAAMAVVIVLAVVGTVVLVAVAIGPRSHETNSGGTVHSAGFVGYRWRLLRIDHGGQVTTVPSNLTASIEFAADHSISINDTVNGITGTFALVPGGYTTANLVTTLVGSGGNDQLRATIIADINVLALAQTVTAQVSPPSGSATKATLQLTVRPARLTFTFEQDGMPRMYPAATPTTPIPRST